MKHAVPYLSASGPAGSRNEISTAHRLRIAALCLLAALAAALHACGDGSSPRLGDEKPGPATPQQALFRIHGLVRLQDNGNPTGAQVFCAGTSYCAFADDEGRYTISSVPAGSYVLVAQKQAYQQAKIDEVTLEVSPQRPRDLDVTVETMELRLLEGPQPGEASSSKSATGGLTGWVAMANGTSPEGVRVALGGTSYAATSGSNGVFLMEGIAPGDYTAQFSREGCSPVSMLVRILPGQITRLPNTVEMASGPAAGASSLSILGKLMFMAASGEAVAPVSDAVAQIIQTRQQVKVNPDGTFEFTNLASGTYTLSATAPGFALNNTVEVKVGAESQVALLVMREKTTEEPEGEPGSITGRVELRGAKSPAQAGVQVALAGSSHSGATDGGGKFTLSNVPEGTGALVCTFQGYKPLEVPDVEIAAGQVTDVGVLTMEPDVEMPKVLSSDPESGATGVVIRPVVPVRIVFNKKMRLETVRASLAIEPRCAFSVERKPQGDEKGDILEILIKNDSPATALRFLKPYRLTISTGATDTDGLALEESFEMTFKTAGLRILASMPEDGARDVPVVSVTSLFLQFNGAVRKETLSTRNLAISPSPGSISPNWDISRDPRTGWTTVRIPLILLPSTSYTARLDSRIQAEDGTRLDDASTRLSFRTGSNAAPRR